MADTTFAQAVVQTARGSRLLKPAPAFAARQLSGGAHAYELRGSGATVHIRHRARDVAILAEVFSAGTYEPPAPVNDLLAGSITVTDLGGNVGLFGVFARQRWTVGRMLTLEPDPDNLRLLQATARNTTRWEVLAAAASVSVGEMQFAAGMESESRQARNGEASITVPTVDVFEIPPCDLLKIDIEGGEWPILTDPRLPSLRARVIVMEWHETGCPETDPPVFAERLLVAAGYGNVEHRPGRFTSNGMLWAWR